MMKVQIFFSAKRKCLHFFPMSTSSFLLFASWVIIIIIMMSRLFEKEINDENTNDYVMLYNWRDNDKRASWMSILRHAEEKWVVVLVEDQPKKLLKPFPTISIQNPKIHCWSQLHFALLSLSPAKITDKIISKRRQCVPFFYCVNLPILFMDALECWRWWDCCYW